MRSSLGLSSACALLLGLAACTPPPTTTKPAAVAPAAVTAAPAVTAVAYGAAACTAAPKQADVTAAKGAHKAATVFFDRGDWENAIRCWADAYAFDCTAHDLLVNIANAQEKKGDRAGALATLKAYLVHKPSAEVSARVKKLEAAISAGK